MGSFQQGTHPSLLTLRTLARSTSACGATPRDCAGQSHSRPPPSGQGGDCLEAALRHPTAVPVRD
ncbi:hypothetical protein [Streptomyces sp. NPDC005374]|uniref:hypothetical protein n=1 Tax=Streptomyces sp. NPDC005374 TaxID=3364713 RepID=UPI0036850A26